MIGISLIYDGLYQLPLEVVVALASTIKGRINKTINLQLIIKWHRRLGHILFFITYISWFVWEYKKWVYFVKFVKLPCIFDHHFMYLRLSQIKVLLYFIIIFWVLLEFLLKLAINILLPYLMITFVVLLYVCQKLGLQLYELLDNLLYGLRPSLALRFWLLGLMMLNNM